MSRKLGTASVLLGIFLFSMGSASAADGQISDEVSNSTDSNVVKKFIGGFMINDKLKIETEGDVNQGSKIALMVTSHGEPVNNAYVAVNGADVGLTGLDGTVEAEVPESPVFRVKAQKGDATGYMRRKLP